MLKQTSFLNFKALADVTVRFEPLTVLVGPNACGKTSTLEGIALLAQLNKLDTTKEKTALRQVDTIFASAPGRYQTRSTSGESLRLTVSGLGHSVALDACKDGKTGQPKYTLQFGKNTILGPVSVATEDTDSNRTQWTRARSPLLKWLKNCRTLQLQAAMLARPAYSDAEVPTLSPGGSGLAAVLSHLASTDPEKLQRITADLQKVVPITRRLRMPRAEVTLREHEIVTFGEQQVRRELKRSVWGNRLEVEVAGEGFIPADQLSEGTLLVLGFLAIVHGPTPPNLLLIDDLERALHPDAQRELIGLLRRMLAERPGMQIICTSHSPYLLDSFEGHEVRVMNLDASGHTVCKPLTDHPDWARFKDDLHAGEFWSTVSESWVRAS